MYQHNQHTFPLNGESVIENLGTSMNLKLVRSIKLFHNDMFDHHDAMNENSHLGLFIQNGNTSNLPELKDHLRRHRSGL